MITKRNWSRRVDLAFFKKGGTITEGGFYDFLFLMGVTMWLNWWIPPEIFKILIENGAF